MMRGATSPVQRLDLEARRHRKMRTGRRRNDFREIEDLFGDVRRLHVGDREAVQNARRIDAPGRIRRNRFRCVFRLGIRRDEGKQREASSKLGHERHADLSRSGPYAGSTPGRYPLMPDMPTLDRPGAPPW